jgi:flagellar motor switch/type III secretory pathway protein FliN
MPQRLQLTDSPHIEHVSYMSSQWNNTLMGVSNIHQLGIPEDNVSYQIVMQPWPNKMVPKHYIGVAFGIKGLISTIWISTWPLVDKLNDFAPTGDLQKIPRELQIELIETVYEHFIRHFEKMLNARIKIYKLFFNKTFKSTPYSIRFSMKSPQQSGNIVAVLIPQPKLVKFFHKKINLIPKKINPFWLEQETRVFYEVGSIKLSIGDLRNLDPSDIVFIQDSNYFQNSLIRLRLLSGECYEILHASTKTVQILSGETIMAENEQEAPIVDINDMPISLNFDLGEEMMSFKQVSQLKPGHILNLKKSFSGLVKIRSQNQLIGQGELVDIEGKVGIRITRLFNQNNTD